MTEDPTHFAFFNEIGIIEQLAGALFDKALPPGMTRAQFVVINHYVRLEPGERSPADLARAFQVTRPTMTSTLSRMARAGLIQIRPDPADGRGKLVSITQRGREVRHLCVAAIGPLLPLLFRVATEAELAEILPPLRRIRERLDGLRS